MCHLNFTKEGLLKVLIIQESELRQRKYVNTLMSISILIINCIIQFLRKTNIKL